MKTHDVIIIGGGPAGCAAAYDLTVAGLDVLILDKKNFPRFKPCAGALTIKAIRRLKYSIAPVVRQTICAKAVGLETRKETVFQGNEPICVTTIRAELDEFCLKQTLNQGACFEIIPGIKAIDEQHDSVILTDKNGNIFQCRYLIGADGVHSQVRKLTGEFVPNDTAFAVEGIVSLKTDKAELLNRKLSHITFDYGAIKNGYGWLIPKHDHINVGLYSSKPGKARPTKTLLLEYAEKRIGTHHVEHITGFPIGTGGESYTPRRSRIFLTGDAAGFTEPLWGEGIHNAIKSGQAAAHAVILAMKTGANANQVYCDSIAEIKQDIENCRKIAHVLYKSLPLCYAILKTRPVRTAILKGFAAGMTITEIRRSFFNEMFLIKKLMKKLIR